MLSIIVSKNPDTRTKAIAKVVGKNAYESYDDQSFTAAIFLDLLLSQSLFETKKVAVIVRDVFASEAVDEIEKRAKEIIEDDRQFIFVVEALLAEQKKKFAKATVVDVSEKIFKKFEASPFTFTRAVVDHKKLDAWVALQKLAGTNEIGRDTHGALFWQFKTTLLENLSGKKTSFSQEELIVHTRDLVRLVHESMFDNKELGIEIEKFVLRG